MGPRAGLDTVKLSNIRKSPENKNTNISLNAINLDRRLFLLLIYRMRTILTHGFYFFIPFFTAVYIDEKIHVLNKEILHLLGLKSAVYNCEHI